VKSEKERKMEKYFQYKIDDAKVFVTSIIGCCGVCAGLEIRIYKAGEEIKKRFFFGYGEKPGEWVIYDPFSMRSEKVSLGEYIKHRIADFKKIEPHELAVQCEKKGDKITIKAAYSIRTMQVGYEMCAQTHKFKDFIEIDL
jgi:hypothetical protein